MLDRIASLCIAVSITACVSNVSDIPTVTHGGGSGGPIVILASAGPADADAARGYWQTAADLAADLQSAGFDPSITLDAGAAPPGAAVIESIEPGGACFSEPLLTVVSAGVIPHIGCVEYGHRFRLRCPNGDSTVEVDASFKVRSYVGWFVWPLALSPNWAYDAEGPPARRREELLLLTQKLREALGTPGCAA